MTMYFVTAQHYNTTTGCAGSILNKPSSCISFPYFRITLVTILLLN